jgi:hypothetical protein
MLNMIQIIPNMQYIETKRGIPKPLGWIVLKLKICSICYPFEVGAKLKHNDFYLNVTYTLFQLVAHNSKWKM